MEYKDLEPAMLAEFEDYEHHHKVRFFDDAKTGLKGCIAIHSINLGPALGGCRFYNYQTENDAIRDVLRLSRGMTYKNALAGLPLGGGKSVILGNPREDKTQELMQAMGEAVQTLDGDYISAEDSGTNEDDMAAMRKNTQYVMGVSAEEGALGGDPSPVTSYGVYCGIKAALNKKYGTKDMSGLSVAVQGLGSVGYELCRLLDEQGAELFVTDINQHVLEQAQQDFENVHIVGLEDIFSCDAKVFSPCALGAQLNSETIPQMSFEIIAGAANNQLAKPEDDQRLADKGILYAPDYAINAAGVIAVCYEYLEQSGLNPFSYELTRENMFTHVEQIESTLDKIFNIAEARNITPGRAADELAEAIFNGNGAANKSKGVA